MGDRNPFEHLEESVESLIDHCRESGIIVCDYQTTNPFHKKINDLIVKMQDVDKLKGQMNDVYVPIEVFSKIDAGQNPLLYTRECMERALARNEHVRGQLDTIRRFRALLIAELSTHFPHEMGRYRMVRGDPEQPPSLGASATSATLASGDSSGTGTTLQGSGLQQSGDLTSANVSMSGAGR